MTITEKEIDILNGLLYDENAKPSFGFYKNCLVWPDEGEHAPLSREGQEFLADLLITRGFIHQQLPYEEWGVTPQSWKYFTKIWEFGLKNIPNWPGFKRLGLFEADKKYMKECLDDPESFL
ncbi:MAG: hypothetical protein LBE22_12430 [Azoarcus sp.]|jgi:hypothetical protein|nr:hypothetical protein [Azoarcus sp.]